MHSLLCFGSAPSMVQRGAMKPNRLVALLLGGVLGGGWGLAWAQTLTLSPSLTLSEEYDDNVLLSPTNRQSDFVTSVSPGVRLEFREHPWTVTAAGSLRGMYYARQPELNSSTAHRQGSLAIEFRPTPRLTASLTDTVVRSLDPGEVDPETGIITGRFASTKNTLTPAVSYQIDPLTHLRLHYSFSTLRSDSPLAQESDTHTPGLFVQHQFTPRTSGTLRYAFSRLQAENRPARDAHLPAVGFAHALSPTIRVSADAGPLFRERPDGSTEITPGGRLQYEQEFSRGRFVLAYDRSARVAGVRGEAATTESLQGTVTLEAARAVTLRLEAGVRTTREPQTAVDFVGYTAGIRLDYRVLQWLSVNAGYRYLQQDDRAGPLDLDRNIIFVGLTASTDAYLY